MGLRQTVYTRTTGGSAGSLVSTRCYPDMLPENVTMPAIRYIIVSYNDATYREYGNATTRATHRVQFDCYSETVDGAAELADAVRTDWDGYSRGTAVGRARVANRIDDGWNDDINAYRWIVDVMVEHKH